MLMALQDSKDKKQSWTTVPVQADASLLQSGIKWKSYIMIQPTLFLFGGVFSLNKTSSATDQWHLNTRP